MYYNEGATLSEATLSNICLLSTPVPILPPRNGSDLQESNNLVSSDRILPNLDFLWIIEQHEGDE